MLQATNYPYYSGSGLGFLGETYDACSMPNPPSYCSSGSWWDNNAGFVVTTIGTLLTLWGNKLTQDQMNKKINESLSATYGAVGKPNAAQQETLVQQLINIGYTEAAAREIISGTVGKGISPKTDYPSWLLPAGIGLVLFVLLNKGKGGA
jgi:hypothetical protein